MKQIAGRDRPAFASLYDRYGLTAYALAYRVTRDRRLAENVVQEAFEAVWCHASRYDEHRAKPSTWLLTIIHHKAVDSVRHEQKRRTEPADILNEMPAATNVHHEAWIGILSARVQHALASLPDTQRQVIELAYYQGYSQSQLADRLAVPLGTIKSRTHTALTRLRLALANTDGTDDNDLNIAA